MICNNNYLADILRVCEIKDLIWVMRFQSPLVYKGRTALFDIYYHLDESVLNFRVVNWVGVFCLFCCCCFFFIFIQILIENSESKQ